MDEQEKLKLAARRKARLEANVLPTSGGSASYGRHREVSRKPKTKPKWAFWPAERKVDAWQAVALSLGLDPDSLQLRSDGFGDFGSGVFITPESFPSTKVQTDFEQRLDLIDRLTSQVVAPLSHYVSLFASLPKPLRIPREFARLAESVEPRATPVQKIDTGDGDSPVDAGDTPTKAVGMVWWSVAKVEGKRWYAQKLSEKKPSDPAIEKNQIADYLYQWLHDKGYRGRGRHRIAKSSILEQITGIVKRTKVGMHWK